MVMVKTTIDLDSSNYHSLEADRQYMSVSLFKLFDECESQAMAYLNGKHEKETTGAMLVGSYTHAAFESEEVFERFIQEHNSVIFKKNGAKYADYEKADLMIETIKNDKLAMFALDGEKEIIFTGRLYGMDWKIKVDNVCHDRKLFSDLKTTRSLYTRGWRDKYGGWVSFIEQWDYVLQMAIYKEIISQNTGRDYEPYIVAVTKESTPDKAVIEFAKSRFDFEYEYAEMKMQRILEVLNKEVDPAGCDRCDYCKSIKQLTRTIEVGELIGI